MEKKNVFIVEYMYEGDTTPMVMIHDSLPACQLTLDTIAANLVREKWGESDEEPEALRVLKSLTVRNVHADARLGAILDRERQRSLEAGAARMRAVGS